MSDVVEPVAHCVVEVRAITTNTDPTIKIYTASVIGPAGVEWPETFGSVEMLRAFLLGIRVILLQEKYCVLNLEWNIQEQWTRPAGKRWIIGRDFQSFREIDLDENGDVLERP